MHDGISVWDNAGDVGGDSRIMKLAGAQELTDFEKKERARVLVKQIG